MPLDLPDEPSLPVRARKPAPPWLDSGWRNVLAALKWAAESQTDPGASG
ncbi:MAG: hypothetical protein ABI577_12955 [bacterium]